MAFAIFTIILAVIFVVFGLAGLAIIFEDDELLFGLLCLAIAVGTVIAWVQYNGNRDTNRDDEGQVVAITQFIDKPTQYVITQPDGYRAEKVTCALEADEQCFDIELGNTVTVKTTYNSVGDVDYRTVVAVTPADR